MRISVLGNPDRYLAPLSGGSGYLLEGGGAKVLLDCGQGVRTSLREGDLQDLHAIVLSHFHFDHCLDLACILKDVPKGTTIIVPPGGKGNLAAIARAYAYEGHFDAPGPVVEARPGQTHTFEKLRLDFAPGKHSAPAFATRARTTGRSIVYTSDTAPADAVRELAKKADLVLAHTLMPGVDPNADHAKVHMTASTAAELAKDAGARRLLLSHRYWESEDEDMLSAAKEHHEDVTLAKADTTYQIG